VGRLLGAWAIPLGVLVFAGSAGYREANFYVQLLFVGSFPLIVLASLICFVFARSVAGYPIGWALAAILTTITIGVAEAMFAGVILVLVLSGPAAALFVLSAKMSPLRISSA
jgi:hypothetical protein